MVTKHNILTDLKNLGVKEGNVLFLRVSYKALGKVEGGPSVLLDSFIEAVGENGMVAMTAFSKRYLSFAKFLYKKEIYSNDNKPTPVTGIIPKMAMMRPDAHYSQSPVYPFILIGKDAEMLANKYDEKHDAYDLLKDLSENYGAKCLRIGGKKYTGTTHIALAEALHSTGNYQIKIDKGLFFKKNNITKWYRATSSAFCYNGMLKLYGKNIDDENLFKKGKLGEGEAVLSDMKDTLDFERRAIGSAPENLLCDNPQCLSCRISFSHSTNSGAFYKSLFKNLMRFKAIKVFAKYMLLKLFGSRHV